MFSISTEKSAILVAGRIDDDGDDGDDDGDDGDDDDHIAWTDDDRDPDLAVISYESSVAFTLNNPTTRLHLKPTASSCCSLRLNKKAPEGEKTRDKA